VTKSEAANEISRLESVLAQSQEATRTAISQRDAARGEVKEVHKQFADLKERLSNAEMENQRLRGYIARVQEDDTVREELVATGDPDGEQRMVPKRKPTLFVEPNQYGTFGSDSGNTYLDRIRDDRAKPKHWITY